MRFQSLIRLVTEGSDLISLCTADEVCRYFVLQCPNDFSGSCTGSEFLMAMTMKSTPFWLHSLVAFFKFHSVTTQKTVQFKSCNLFPFSFLNRRMGLKCMLLWVQNHPIQFLIQFQELTPYLWNQNSLACALAAAIAFEILSLWCYVLRETMVPLPKTVLKIIFRYTLHWRCRVALYVKNVNKFLPLQGII